MRALPASPFAEMSVSIVGNNHLATTTINTSGGGGGGGGGSSSSSSGCSSSLEDDHFGQVAYKLSLLCSAGSSTSTTTSTSNGVASDGSDNVENHLSYLPFSPQHHQQQQQQQQQAQPLGMNGGAGVSPSSVPTTGAFDDNYIRTSVGRRSANMTECVRVPSSEHVAEIVGRQGCKIKALRAKTNTYIKTPVRGEEPVFVVTGRREDVCAAKREIMNAAQHFTQIRASRRGSSTSSFGSNGSVGPSSPALGPGQTTIKVAVPYRVVGLVVGPKGATIKRIQQQTHTYIVTPSRDKEPIFEVTGTPENVQAAKREIEAHIVNRTGGLVDTTNIPDYQPPTPLQQHHHHQQQQHSSSTASPTVSVSQHHLGHAAAAGSVVRGSGILQNGGLLHSQTSSNLFQHQNEHLFQHHNDRYAAGGFALEGRRLPGTSVSDDFDSNGHDAIFNDVSGSLNGVGGGDALGFGSSSSDYMYGGARHDAGGAPAASGSGQFGHYTGAGVVNGGELIGRLSGSAPQDATSAFVFPPHEPYTTVNGYLQQNGHGHAHVTNGFEAGGGEDASSSCLAGIDPLLGSPPNSWFNGRPSSFSSPRSGPVCSTSLGSLFCSKSNYSSSSCDDVIANSSSLLHRRSSSFAGGIGNSFALESDLTSAHANARYSPPTAPLLSDFVNGAGAINGIHHGAGTPPLNGSTSPPSVSSSGFSSSGPATGDDPTSLLEQAAHASRRMRSLPLATASLKAALSSLSTSYPSNPSTALTPMSHSSQELSVSPPPVDLVGLSLSENLDLLPACERNSSSSSSNSSSSSSSSSSSVATPTAPCCMSAADDGKVELRRCVVCRERPTVAALVPCGHNLFCMECASKLLEMPQKKRVCPACDEPFSQAIRIRAQ